MGELEATGYKVNKWSGGQPTATWYDKHGDSFVLPADPYSIEHYQDRGLTLHPPGSPAPLVEDNDWSEGSVNATQGGPILEEAPKEAELFGGIPFVEEPERKGRGPDKKPRKKRKKRRNRA